MRILWVAPDFIYPPNHGGRIDLLRRAYVFQKCGYEVDFLATVMQTPNERDIAVVRKLVRSVRFVSRKMRVGQFFGKEPMQVASRVGLESVALNCEYDVVFLEGEYVSRILRNPGLKARNVVLRIHNYEPKYFRQLGKSARSPLHKLYYFMEARKFGRLIKELWPKCSSLLFVSQEEHERYGREFNGHPIDTKAIYMPPPVLMTDRLPTAKAGATVLFVGSLFMPNNREAVEWYQQNVHRKLFGVNGYRLLVAGNARGVSRSWLQEVAAVPGTELIESPEDLDDIYRSAVILINPMRHGAGIKWKTINAAEEGLPVVSTTIGAEGLGLLNGVHLVVADSPEDFLKGIQDLLGSADLRTQMVHAARKHLSETFDHGRFLAQAFSSENLR
jgi:glycosyltransferase involved in cell wall biosynthesis